MGTSVPQDSNQVKKINLSPFCSRRRSMRSSPPLRAFGADSGQGASSVPFPMLPKSMDFKKINLSPFLLEMYFTTYESRCTTPQLSRSSSDLTQKPSPAQRHRLPVCKVHVGA